MVADLVAGSDCGVVMPDSNDGETMNLDSQNRNRQMRVVHAPRPNLFYKILHKKSRR
jgi:hypothetical protein